MRFNTFSKKAQKECIEPEFFHKTTEPPASDSNSDLITTLDFHLIFTAHFLKKICAANI